MKFTVSNQKISMALVLLTLSVIFSNAQPTTTESVHLNSLIDDEPSIQNSTGSTNQTSKRYKRMFGCLWGFDPFTDLHWCNGEITDAYSSQKLGKYCNTDECCREHVKCRHSMYQDRINNFDESSCVKADVTPCECDNDFRTCLKGVLGGTSPVSTAVGKKYFTRGKKCITTENIEAACIMRNAYGKCTRCDYGKLRRLRTTLKPF